MRVKTVTTENFKPVSINITFESQDELDMFGALFNHVDICDILRESNLSPEPLREAIMEIGGNTHRKLTAITDKLF